MRIAAGFCLLLAISAVPAMAQDTAMASLTEPQLKSLLVGDWTLTVGFGAGPMSITDFKDGQLSVSGKMILNYDTLTVTRGHVEATKLP